MMTAIVRYAAAHAIEIVGMVATTLGIWLTARRLLICWPVVLIADFLYLVVFYRARLYSDAILQIFFILFTLYGWWHWWRGMMAQGDVRIEPLSIRGLVSGLVVGAVGAALLGSVMVRVGAALPHIDAILASYSLVASWWAARKYVANWWLWIAVDVVYIGEYLYKNLLATALLYAGLVVLAIIGLRDWRHAATVQIAA